MSGILDRLWARSPAAPATMAAPPDHFDRAFAVVLRHEGGAKLTNDPDDPGGLTRYGISKRANPDIDVANLTEEKARAIYRERYWDACRCGEMPWSVAIVVYDAAVQHGVGYARRALQSALKVAADGIIGAQTMAALDKADPVPLALEIQAQRILKYAALPGWGKYGLGWSRRAFDIAAQAAG